MSRAEGDPGSDRAQRLADAAAGLDMLLTDAALGPARIRWSTHREIRRPPGRRPSRTRPTLSSGWRKP